MKRIENKKIKDFAGKVMTDPITGKDHYLFLLCVVAMANIQSLEPNWQLMAAICRKFHKIEDDCKFFELESSEYEFLKTVMAKNQCLAKPALLTAIMEGLIDAKDVEEEPEKK